MPANKTHWIDFPASRIPVLASGDVVVVGGGNAGFVAAIAAARGGARTVLVERYGYVGGALTGTYVTTPSSFADSDSKKIIGGIGWEFAERMEKAGYARLNRKVWTVQMQPEVSKEIALDMVSEAGVELLLHSWAGEVCMEGEIIKGVIVQTKSGRQAVLGKVFVDASGDADLAAMAGAPFAQLASDALWQTTKDLTIANIDYRQVLAWGRTHDDLVVWMGGDVSEEDSTLGPVISLMVVSEAEGEPTAGGGYVGPVPTIKLMPFHSIGRVQGSVEINPLDVKSLTWAEREGRRKAMEHLAHLKRTVPGFENAVVVGESPLGVRESRRISGEYVITLQDLLTNARFSDVVALNCRPLDRHMKGEVFEYDLLSGHHDIPLRALIPQKTVNLLVAGRCLSCDHESHASLRGAATCLATGHAAGAAACLAALGSGEVRQVNLPQLQKLLLQQGAILKAD